MQASETVVGGYQYTYFFVICYIIHSEFVFSTDMNDGFLSCIVFSTRSLCNDLEGSSNIDSRF